MHKRKDGNYKRFIPSRNKTKERNALGTTFSTAKLAGWRGIS